MTNLAKAYLGVCTIGAVIGGTIFAKVMMDITGLTEDLEPQPQVVPEVEDFYDLDDDDDDVSDVKAMMQAQNAAQEKDPVQA